MLLLLVGAASASAEPISPSAVRETLAAYVKAHPYAAVAVGVIEHRRKATYFARGSRAKWPLDVHTRFQIGSITKVFTATILARMVQTGRLHLNDPIQRYLPAGVTAPAYRRQPITLLALATHMSGLPTDPQNLTSYQDYSIKQLDDALGATQLTRAPGSHWTYSNFGFAVLGQALADAAHVSYVELVREHILKPLGMNDTVVIGSAQTRHHMLPAFGYSGVPVPASEIGPGIAPAGSIESDLKDMMLFAQANLEARQGPLGPELAFAQQPRARVAEYNMSMGLGWQNVLPATHRTPDDLGDLPPGSLEKGGNVNGYSSFIGLNHGANWAFVAMTNVNDDDFQSVIAHAISPRTARMPILWTTVKREPSPFSGRYLFGKRNPLTFEIFKYKGDLYGWFPSATNPERLAPLGPARYSLPSQQLELTFRRSSSGRLTGLSVVQGNKKPVRVEKLP
ncbi:MAG TPA: serine hydrolase domain-containing protein [Candidatus Elarobacter sp.]|nr:serine hydrolase domain-containing protein [Candidatus Elarobacter sp.]